MRPTGMETVRATVDEAGVDAFRALAADQLPRLVGLAHKLIGDEAEDAVQDCLLKAFQKFDQLKDVKSGPAWLTSILVNCCRDRGRARGRSPEQIEFESLERFSLFRHISYEDPFPYSDSLHLDFLDEFGPEDVREVVRSLPEIYRVPMVLVYMEGYLAREAATMTGVPLGTLLSRLHRGRKLFEREMWDYAEAHGLLRRSSS